MSKVIKSSSVRLESAKVVGNDDSLFQIEDQFTGNDFDSGLDLSPEAQEIPEQLAKQESVQDVEQVKAQTNEILRETEQMVKELLETARQEAEKIIRNANEEAENIVSAGRIRLKEIEDSAYQQGWQLGCEEGHKQAEAAYREMIEEAHSMVDRAHEERRAIIAGSEDEIVQMAVAVARKVIGQELAADPDMIVKIVKRAIEKTSDREELTVRVNPENLESTLGAQDDISQTVKGVRKLKIVADSTVAPGGCVVETPNGTVDARIERQLSEIEQALMEVGPNA